MPEFQLNADGQLVDEQGTPFQIDGEPVTVPGALPQDKVNQVVQDRLKKEQGKLQQLQERIAALQKEAEGKPHLENMLKQLKDEKSELERQVLESKEKAEKQIATQLQTLTRDRDAYKAALDTERQGRMRDALANQILGKAGSTFINAARDLVPALLGRHKREPKLGADGKPIEGQFEDLFEVDFRDENGNPVRDFLPLEKAIETFGAQPENQHYLQPTARSGSGGGKFGGPTITKRSQLKTEADVLAFVGKFGAEAFEKLDRQ